MSQTLTPFRAEARRPFPYSEDGVHSVQKVPGEVFNVRADLLPGLLAEGVVAATEAELTKPEELVKLRAAHASPAIALGVTPAVRSAAMADHTTQVEDEHAEPLRRRAQEQLGAGRMAAAVEGPGNPPPVDDRMTPPHPLGVVVDADDRAARDSAVQAAKAGEPLREELAPEAAEAAQVTGKPLGEVLRGASAEDAAKATADERGAPGPAVQPAAAEEEKAGEYETKVDRPAAGKAGNKAKGGTEKK